MINKRRFAKFLSWGCMLLRLLRRFFSWGCVVLCCAVEMYCSLSSLRPVVASKITKLSLAAGLPQITKKGKAIAQRTAPEAPRLIATQHDRTKDTPIPADQPHPFLQQIGLQTSDGRVKASMRDKLSQINEFLKLLTHTDAIEQV